MVTTQNRHSAIALISMPWAIFNRPSIQLGALKSYVEKTTACAVTALHPYLDIAKEIGTGNYTAIADSSWAGEALFSALLFEDRMPPRTAEPFFEHMIAKSADYRFFAEIRATTSKETLQKYRGGGLDTIQVGIEALSASLLEKMNKGVSVIENIAIMKHAMAAGNSRICTFAPPPAGIVPSHLPVL